MRDPSDSVGFTLGAPECWKLPIPAVLGVRPSQTTVRGGARKTGGKLGHRYALEAKSSDLDNNLP